MTTAHEQANASVIRYCPHCGSKLKRRGDFIKCTPCKYEEVIRCISTDDMFKGVST